MGTPSKSLAYRRTAYFRCRCVALASPKFFWPWHAAQKTLATVSKSIRLLLSSPRPVCFREVLDRSVIVHHNLRDSLERKHRSPRTTARLPKSRHVRFSYRLAPCNSLRPYDGSSSGASRSRDRPLPTPLSLGNHFPSASVYHERRPKKGAAGFFSIVKEKGEYLDQPRIRRICVIASLLDVITSRHEAKFVD